MKRILSLLVAFAAVISISACGASKETAPETAKQETTNTPATEKAETTEKTTATTTAETTTEVTTTEPAAPVADTAYWDMLCEEYNRIGDNNYAKTVAIIGDTLYGYIDDYNDFATYNLKSKEIKYNRLLFARLYNDRIFSYSNQYGDTIHCYDLQMNLLSKAQIFNGIKDYYYIISEEGYIILPTAQLNYQDDKATYSISPDLTEIKVLSVKTDVAHGKTEEIKKLSVIGLSGNTLYAKAEIQANNKTGLFAIDIKTGEYEELDENKYSFLTGSYFMIGKYFVCLNSENGGIYNLETAEKLCDYDVMWSNNRYYDYKNGNMYYAIKNSDKCTEIYKYVLPLNYKEFAKDEKEYAKEYGTLVYTTELEQKADPKFVGDDYFIFRDNTGCYLVNIATGEEDELVLDWVW